MNIRNIITRLKRDKYNRYIFKSLQDVYLVGGFIRDTIIGRQSRDRDYIVRNDPFDVANTIRESLGGKVITFKEESTVRLALTGGHTLDFSRMQGNLTADLAGRDFTINSIAFNPDEGLIDEVKGMDDLRNGLIRTFQARNLESDPLRCLRAYRMMSELNWPIEKQTRDGIGAAKRGLKKISFERITLELFKLINGQYHINALRSSNYDSVLSMIICNNINILGDNIKNLLEVNAFIKKLPFKEQNEMDQTFSHNLTHAGMIRLEQILYGCSFDSIRLTYSRLILKRLLKAHMFMKEYAMNRGCIDIFDVFFPAKEMIIDLVCLSREKAWYRKAKRFLEIHNKRLLTTEEIIELTDAEGKRLGSIIYHLKKEMFYRRVKTKKQARDYISHMYANHP